MLEIIWNAFAWYLVVLGINSFAFFIDTKIFYKCINKPYLSPPGWVYGVVWNMLFILYGLSAWYIWKNGGWENNTTELILFLCFVISLPIWSFLFFQFKLMIVSAVYIVFIVLVLQIIVCVFFFLESFIAGILNIPGLIWIIFASYLNIGIAYLNCIYNVKYRILDGNNTKYNKLANNSCKVEMANSNKFII